MRCFRLQSAALALVIVGLAGPALAAGDPVKGKQVFRRCAVCHTVKPGRQGIVGPNLRHVFDRKAATAKGYTRYSRAMKKSGLTWDAKTLDKYLKDPRKVVPGTHMTFPGLRREKDRRNVIAYLESLKKK